MEDFQVHNLEELQVDLPHLPTSYAVHRLRLSVPVLIPGKCYNFTVVKQEFYTFQGSVTDSIVSG